jgi:hypothetical protein
MFVGRGRIVVDQDRHQMAIDDVQNDTAAGDDRVLIPIAIPY